MKIGDKVRVLAIPDWLLRDLLEAEQNCFGSQLGKVVEVRGIQSHQHVWLSFADGTEGFALEFSEIASMDAA
jgi:hypothetical protein